MRAKFEDYKAILNPSVIGSRFYLICVATSGVLIGLDIVPAGYDGWNGGRLAATTAALFVFNFLAREIINKIWESHYFKKYSGNPSAINEPLDSEHMIKTSILTFYHIERYSRYISIAASLISAFVSISPGQYLTPAVLAVLSTVLNAVMNECFSRRVNPDVFGRPGWEFWWEQNCENRRGMQLGPWGGYMIANAVSERILREEMLAVLNSNLSETEKNQRSQQLLENHTKLQAELREISQPERTATDTENGIKIMKNYLNIFKPTVLGAYCYLVLTGASLLLPSPSLTFMLGGTFIFHFILRELIDQKCTSEYFGKKPHYFNKYDATTHRFSFEVERDIQKMSKILFLAYEAGRKFELISGVAFTAVALWAFVTQSSTELAVAAGVTVGCNVAVGAFKYYALRGKMLDPEIKPSFVCGNDPVRASYEPLSHGGV